MFRVSFISCLAALVAFILAAMMINHGLVNSSMPAGPGLTLDEAVNIDQAIYLADALEQHGPLLFTPTVVQTVFDNPISFMHDYPPLGRLLLGMSHQLTAWLIPGSEKTTYNVPAARLGSCFAFAMTVLLVTEFARRQYGSVTGIASAIMLIGMPHLIGHARLASLESATNLAWVAAMLPLLSWWTGPKPPSTFRSLISGLVWGLLLLTKIQGIFLPPIIYLWAVWSFRWQAIRPLACWSLAGTLLFLAGWPWLWLDPAQNIMDYFGQTLDRMTLYCWYFGQRYTDKSVPWHFPFVMTLVSLPAWTVLCFVQRAVYRGLDRIEQLLLLGILLPLTVFAVPGVPVYDGTRLFVIVMPSIALIAARGFALWCDPIGIDPTRRRPSWCVRATAWGLVTIVPLFWIMQPLAISQYGLLAAGNRGAASMGMEACYWTDTLNGDFWKQVPENSTVFVAPVIYPKQLFDIEGLVPIVQHRNIQLVPFEYDPEKQKGLLLLIHRLADLRTSLRTVPPGGVVIAEAAAGGVITARLIDTTKATLPDPLQQ